MKHMFQYILINKVLRKHCDQCNERIAFRRVPIGENVCHLCYVCIDDNLRELYEEREIYRNICDETISNALQIQDRLNHTSSQVEAARLRSDVAHRYTRQTLQTVHGLLTAVTDAAEKVKDDQNK